jgi:exodeoxyribonuclease V
MKVHYPQECYLCGMIRNFISKTIRTNLGFEPTEQQDDLIDELSAFLVSSAVNKLFLLKGYAGTGKTTVVGAMVKALDQLNQKSVLLAPTGRAAKVFSSYSGKSAFTIHKKIYRQKSISEFKFQIGENLHKHTVFIVDEASMISNSGEESAFGSGYLLDDLIRYVYSGEGCFILFMGDTAQLPPVMQPVSLALDVTHLEGYDLLVSSFTLTHVVRQALDSGILSNATLLRESVSEKSCCDFPKFRTNQLSDIRRINGIELIDELQRCYTEVGLENTIVITRSNKQANIYNKGIRAKVMQKEDELSNGDLLMVTKNNYFWNKAYENIDFIANGDILEIVRIRKYKEMYNLRFADLTLRSLDYDWEIDARICLDTLYIETQAELKLLTNGLFDAILEDYTEIKNKRFKYKKVYENEFFNALQMKFAYAVTCHKAQGGQWNKVFVDMGRISENQVDPEFYRWLYTAITRAQETLYLVNFPDECFMSL